MFTDDEVSPSSSSAEYFESPHEAKRKELKKQLEKKGMKQAADKQGASLSDLKRALLKGKIEDKDKKPLQDDKNKPQSMGTRTREQEIKDQEMGADAKPDARSVAQQSNDQKQVEKAALQQEIQNDQA